MHYPGPYSPAFSQLNKKKHSDAPKFKLLIHDTGPTHNMHISYTEQQKKGILNLALNYAFFI